MLKTKPGFSIRQVLDAYIIMGTGKEAYRPNCIMSLNESGAFLWNLISEGIEEKDLAPSLVNEYGVDSATAENDVSRFLQLLREKELINE
ncbi:MAG: PqqD family protein [Clostridiales bacterium]|nr:PqqD family protein [Clostridiales bacterium]